MVKTMLFVCYNEIMFRPDTDLYLLKCPLEMDNNNQLTFANANAQFNYFNSLPKIEIEASSYQRKDSTVRYPGNIEDLYGYNYCMYRNHNYSNKWFYAYVTDLQWSSEKMTLVTLKTDVWQTWQFNLSFKKSFVEREHVNNDAIGLNTIPENLEIGDYICNAIQDFQIAKPDDGTAIVVFQVTTITCDQATFPAPTKNVFNGIPQGCYMFGFPLTNANIGKIQTVIGTYDGAGKGESIVSIFLVPYLASEWEIKNGGGTLSAESFYVPKSSWESHTDIVPDITINTTLDSYRPKNNKLYTFPYNYLYVSNNAGVDIDYHYEDFNGSPAFALYTAIEQGGSVFLMPQNSKKSGGGVTSDGWSEGIPAGKLPILSWTSDYYLNWQAVNGSNIKLQALTSAVNWGFSTAGILAGNGGGSYSTGNLASDVAGIMQKIKEAKITPPQAEGNVSTGDVGFSTGESKFTFRKMSIRAEYARIIDDYFTAFGYRVNAFKVPNRYGRRNWNYIKTVGCNIEGDIPQGDMQEIKSMFDSGITLWHNTNTYLDYSQNNNIV